jgi:hypothetical protein
VLFTRPLARSGEATSREECRDLNETDPFARDRDHSILISIEAVMPSALDPASLGASLGGHGESGQIGVGGYTRD